MKVIIPLAGKGTRLRPHTHVTPKPMLKVAGKTVMAYILEDLRRLGVEEIIYVTGHLREKVEAYTREAFPDIPARFIVQAEQNGTAGAVALAREFVDQPVFIIFVDTIFDADLSVVNTTDADGIIWVKEVEDYQRFGVVLSDERQHMTRIVEKPKEPISKRANIGLYYIRDWKLMYEGIEEVMRRPKNKGEYYLTDAFQYMIEHGARIRVIDVEGWYDAGELGTLLETNRTMLEKGRARRPDGLGDDARIVDPVYIEDGVTIGNSTVGPNVSIGAGTVIQSSTVSDSVIGEKAEITVSALHRSLIGDAVSVEGFTGSLSVGDHAEVRGATGAG